MAETTEELRVVGGTEVAELATGTVGAVEVPGEVGWMAGVRQGVAEVRAEAWEMAVVLVVRMAAAALVMGVVDVVGMVAEVNMAVDWKAAIVAGEGGLGGQAVV